MGLGPQNFFGLSLAAPPEPLALLSPGARLDHGRTGSATPGPVMEAWASWRHVTAGASNPSPLLPWSWAAKRVKAGRRRAAGASGQF